MFRLKKQHKRDWLEDIFLDAIEKVKPDIEDTEENAEKISLDLIARNMYLSSAYISKIFKEETGEAPINYLIKMRLERARIQLESDNGQSIKAISNSVGYDDVYYFSKLFKKYYGMSPVHYRSKYKKVV